MARPRIHLYMPCWNEAVLLPHFFRHYAFVERFVIFDNGSTDTTRALIAAEARAELRDFDTGGQIDERAYLRIKNEAWKESRGSADYVIVCDTDEFLFHPALDQVLDDMRAAGATVMRPAGYEMVGARPPLADEDLLSTIPDGVRRFEFDKSVLFDPSALAEIGYGVGAHVAAPKGHVRHYARPGLALLHYKNLGFDHVRRRIDAVAPRVSAYNRAQGLALSYGEPARQTRMRLDMLAHIARRVVPLPDTALPPLTPPDDLDDLRAAAMAASRSGDWTAVVAGIDRVLSWRPDDVDGLAAMGTALRRLRQDTEAAWCFRRALAIDPERPEIWFDYGEVMLAHRSIAMAAACFRSALQRRKTYPEAWLRLGEALDAEGKAPEAERAWRRAVAHGPQFAPALRRLGEHLATAGRVEEAAPLLRAWAAAAPDDPAAVAAVAALAT